MLISILISVLLSIPKQHINSSYLSNSTTNLIIMTQKISCDKTPPIIEKDQVLLPMGIVKKYFDPNLYWDDKMHRIVTTSKDRVAKIKLNSNMVSINNELTKCTASAKSVKGTIYMPITFLKDVYGLYIQYSKNYNVVMIDYQKQLHKQGTVIQLLTPLRKNNYESSSMLAGLKFNDDIDIFNYSKGWYKVRTKKGLIGFVDAKSVWVESKAANSKSNTLINMPAQKISLAWDQLLNINSIKKTEGLNILAPTWFYVSDKDGTVESKASDESIKAYIQKAHQENYKVWAMFTNSFSPIISSSILNDGTLRDKVINQIIKYAVNYNIDGINVDFENMNSEDKEMFSQFVRELAPMLRAYGKVISVDISAPTGSENSWSCYDAKALSDASDYIAVMTYDQHWGTCTYSGSVAQYSWVENKLQATLNDVASSKLLLGIPFYTRGWKEELDNQGSTVATQYDVFSIQEARNEVKTNNAFIVWDNQSGQFYAQYNKDNAIYKIWLESPDSINLKSSLVQKYNLAGTAVWEKSYAEPDAWKILNKNLKYNSYEAWINANKNLYARLYRFYLCER